MTSEDKKATFGASVQMGMLSEEETMKFAFLANVEGVTPETYSTVFESAGNYNLVAGVDGIEAGKEYALKLAADGFDMIDLCGDFDDEVTAELQEKAGPDVKIRHADYTVDEMVKLDHLDSLRDYGVIIMEERVEKPHEVVLRSESCDMRINFVNDMKQAKQAAIKLVEKRIDFIELCSWFDLLRMEAIVEATGNRVPVGTCGELDPGRIK